MDTVKTVDLDKLTLICPVNDGEAKMIIEIASALSIDTRVSTQSWGATLDKEPEKTFENLKEIVIIIEMPGINIEGQLQQRGHNVIIIDHHYYGPELNRYKNQSSLEQFAELVGHSLNRFQAGLAINDRSWIYGLVAAGYTKEEIEEIRLFDLAAQGLNSETKMFLSQKAAMSKEVIPGIVVCEIPNTMTESYFRDLIALRDLSRIISTLIFKRSKEGEIKQIVFSGSPEIVKKLLSKFKGSTGGDERYSMVWWINQDVSESVKNYFGIK